MNTDILKGNWKVVKGKVKEMWADLTDDEITRVEGNYDVLVGEIQKKYGQSKEKAEDSVNSFLKSLRSEEQNAPVKKNESTQQNESYKESL